MKSFIDKMNISNRFLFSSLLCLVLLFVKVKFEIRNLGSFLIKSFYACLQILNDIFANAIKDDIAENISYQLNKIK